MPEYNFVCHECKMFFDKEYSMKNAPERSRCPDCNKLSNRDWQEIAVHFKGDCQTNRSLARRANESAFEQKRLANALVNKTKESLGTATTEQFYNRMIPGENFSEHYSDYTVRKLSSTEVLDKENRFASIGKTIDSLGSYHKHQPRRHKLKDAPKFKDK
jgi:predicted nucleic acid-binding Zn ribbon protein